MKTIKILLVDDSSLVRDSLRAFLDRISNVIIVGECSDGDEVLDKLKENKIDLVFMDIMMKNIGGFEAAGIVKDYDEEIKVIFFSFMDYWAVKRRMKDYHIDGFISKIGVTEKMILKELKKVPGFKIE
jgi:DNA-binding NarL/FixJ family response regulator